MPAALLCALSAPALACSIAVLTHELDANEQQVDKAAPTTVSTATVARITRGKGSSFGSAGSCDDIGFIQLNLAGATDDRTPADKLGYRLVLQSGQPPAGLSFSPKGERLFSGSLNLAWADGATDGQEPFDFTVRVITIDLAGNESPPSAPLQIVHAGSTGCRAAGSTAAAETLPIAAALLALLLTAARRRRRAAHAR